MLISKETLEMPLATTEEPGHYEFKTDNVYFWMLDGRQRVRCSVSLEALELFNPELERRPGACVACFDGKRERIERAASAKFDMRDDESDGTIMLKKKDL
jgi:hypothetical protein